MLAVAELAAPRRHGGGLPGFRVEPRVRVPRSRSASGRLHAHPITVRPRPPLAFSIAEQDLLLGVLDSERFADMAPADGLRHVAR